ncbi:class I SAM-dependent methyltransferase [Elusimicrobiota bacterium]
MNNEYIPIVTNREKQENYQLYTDRIAYYAKKGLDFIKSRKGIIEKAGNLHGSILEVGCGNGYTTLPLTRAGYNFTSIDMDIEALKKTALSLAHEEFLKNVKFYVMDALNMGFKDKIFNNVICVNLLHHIENKNSVLTEINRILCDKGKVIIADFNIKGMEIVDGVHKEEGRVHENFGISEEETCAFFDKSGYQIKKYDEICHWILVASKSSGGKNVFA